MLIQEGASFKYRDLDNPGAEEITVHFIPCRVRIFLDSKDVKDISDADYFVPASGTSEAVNALLPSGASLFKTTTTERYQVESAQLIESLDLLPEATDEYKLYFPVMEKCYPKFVKQKIGTQKATAVQLEVSG